ncbi:MAG: hypothetical protein OXN89_07430 [Bryobacterales bacterium]|nr:hypothetical protein [Bryobacterales bacterium]
MHPSLNQQRGADSGSIENLPRPVVAHTSEREWILRDRQFLMSLIPKALASIVKS